MRAADCTGCGARLVPGARFCTACGTEAESATAVPSAGGRRRGRRPVREEASSSNLPWYIAGAVLLVLLFVLVTPMIMGDDDSVPARGTAPFDGGGQTGGLAPLTGTPREQADRLFNRVMTAREQGNTAEALQFAPMGIQAYQMAEPLDDDGLYHLATLQNTASDFDGARQTAERILQRNPNHLLALASGAEAATGAGDRAAALDYHRRFLAAYEAEIGRGLIEYQDHSRILPEYRQTAQQAVGS
jgi:hypothetical protein